MNDKEDVIQYCKQHNTNTRHIYKKILKDYYCIACWTTNKIVIQKDIKKKRCEERKRARLLRVQDNKVAHEK